MSDEPESTPETGAETAPIAGAETRSPDQWAKVLFPANKRGQLPFAYWKHRVADIMHGWSRHQHAEAKPMQLSAADYEAAIAAVTGQTPHAAALSRHKPPRKKLEPKSKES